MKTLSGFQIHFIIDPALITEGLSNIIERVLSDEKVKFQFDSKLIEKESLCIIFSNSKKHFSEIENKICIYNVDYDPENSSLNHLNFRSYESVLIYTKNIFDILKNYFIRNKIRASEKCLDIAKKENEQLDSEAIRALINEFDFFIELESSLLKEESIKEWNGVFKTIFKKSNWSAQVAIVNSVELLETDWAYEELGHIYKLPFEDYFLAFKPKPTEKSLSNLRLELIISTCLKSLESLDEKLIRSDGEIDFWKRIFSKIPYPMAIISQLSDLLIYNEHFAKMGILPRECLSFKDQETIEIHQQLYVVKKIELKINFQPVFYFVFYTTDRLHLELEKKGSKIDDLGIISSSVAHELNNPLAGIIAALTMISLEDDWSEEALDEIRDMQNGARRCKELVEIFLGFSRYSINNQSSFSLKNSLDQALNLLRFRMVESNIRVDIKFVPTLESFHFPLNSSIVSMVLYLILSELITSFGHYKLIAGKKDFVLIGEVVEFSNQIIIRFAEDFEYDEKIAQSKLIQQLLIFEKIEINFLKKEMRLVRKLN